MWITSVVEIVYIYLAKLIIDEAVRVVSKIGTDEFSLNRSWEYWRVRKFVQPCNKECKLGGSLELEVRTWTRINLSFAVAFNKAEEL